MKQPLKIQLEGLKLGNHDFEFLLDKTFFSELDYTEITEGEIIVKLRLNKKERLFDLKFVYEGFALLPCDRCGDDFKFEINFFSESILRYGSESFEDEGLIIITNQTSELLLSHYLYETLIVNLPQKIVHPNLDVTSNCNPDNLKKLKDLSEKNKEETIDPRWEALRKLK